MPVLAKAAYLRALLYQRIEQLKHWALAHLWRRIDFDEGAETQSGSNGVNGADETSEDLSMTWAVGSSPPQPAISKVKANTTTSKVKTEVTRQ